MNRSKKLVDVPLLLGRYRPLRLLARGGSASVFRGRDEVLGRDIAIKLFNADHEADREKHRDELRVLAGLSHHGVVSIIDAGIDESSPTDARPFLIMELVRGLTLKETLDQRDLSAREIGEVGYEIAEVLEYVHSRGVIHRDITPSNIMLVDYGTTASRPRARLTDFGIALDASSAATEDGRITATIAFASPEQVCNAKLTPASDVYSLGLVLLHSFTHEPAFPGTLVHSAVMRVSHDVDIPDLVAPALRELLTHMTARDPVQRPGAADVLERLRVALRSLRD
ncbi:MAG: serine/threonine-protein kinase [Lacisediminihabitans sp.]